MHGSSIFMGTKYVAKATMHMFLIKQNSHRTEMYGTFFGMLTIYGGIRLPAEWNHKKKHSSKRMLQRQLFYRTEVQTV